MVDVRISSRKLDAESQAMIWDGLSLAQLAQAYEMDPRDLARRIHGIPPDGVRNGSPIYKHKSVAPRMWNPTGEQIDDAMARLHHSHLPKILTKEYWAGQRSRQDYQIKAGTLVPTSKVIQSVGELFKLVKMNTQLLADGVERRSELTDVQRAIIKELTDGMLADLHKAIVERFSAPEPADDEEL
jgi:hypothetical protein